MPTRPQPLINAILGDTEPDSRLRNSTWKHSGKRFQIIRIIRLEWSTLNPAGLNAVRAFPKGSEPTAVMMQDMPGNSQDCEHRALRVPRVLSSYDFKRIGVIR